MSARRALVVVLAFTAAGLFAVYGRLAHVQASALQVGGAALADGKEARAIDAFRRAVRAHHPFSSRTDEALRHLLELGAALEERGDPALAELAYQSAWGGVNATAVPFADAHALAREAEARLVRMRGEPLARGRAPARPLGKAAAALGLALALLAGYRLLSRERAAGSRLLLVEISLFFAGISIFVAGALHA